MHNIITGGGSRPRLRLSLVGGGGSEGGGKGGDEVIRKRVRGQDSGQRRAHDLDIRAGACALIWVFN